MKVPSFDELDADQLKELIQSGSGKKSKKHSAKKSKQLPLNEEKCDEKSQPDEKRNVLSVGPTPSG